MITDTIIEDKEFDEEHSDRRTLCRNWSQSDGDASQGHSQKQRNLVGCRCEVRSAVSERRIRKR
jgi:hypothetical protein